MKAADISVRKLFGQNNCCALCVGQSEAELTVLVRQGSSSPFESEGNSHLLARYNHMAIRKLTVKKSGARKNGHADKFSLKLCCAFF